MTKKTTPAPKSAPGDYQLANIPVDQLLFGQEHPLGAMNARLTDRGEDIEALAASIEAEGILQPLLVWKDGGKFYVVDGSRRLTAVRAIRANALASEITTRRLDSLPAAVFEGGDIDTALGRSLAANVLQLPLHEVDQYEAFCQLPQDWTREQIRDRFGLESVAVVDRILALGKLAKPIRDAWRAGEIDENAAKSYTLEPDPERQVAIFKKLGKNRRDSRHSVREAIVGDSGSTGKLVAFVGEEAYQAAGGTITRDLFADRDSNSAAGVSDRALLQRMADEKVEAKCKAIVDAGWAWASPEKDLPQNWSWSWKRDHIGAKGASKAAMAVSGAVVSIDHQGKFSIEYGVRKPGTKLPKTKAQKAADADRPKAEPKISREIEMQMMREATKAVAAAMALQPGVAIAALLAGLAAGGECPVRASYQGLDSDEPIDRMADFGKALDVQLAKGKGAVDDLARVACEALDLTIANDPNPFQEPDVKALVAHIDPAALNKAIRQAWDATAYFEGTSKAFSQRAIEEALGAEAWAGIATATKAEIAEFAWVNVPKTGWLPPELRAPGYDGPSGKTRKGKR